MGDCCHCVFFIKVVKDKNVSSIPKYGLSQISLGDRERYIVNIYNLMYITLIYIFYNIIYII